VKLGESASTFDQQARILENRIVDWKIYKVNSLMRHCFSFVSTGYHCMDKIELTFPVYIVNVLK